MTHRIATDAEKAHLKRLATLRSGLVVLPFIFLATFLVARQIESEFASIALSVAGLLLMLGLVAYISFGLRCPRCSSWIPLPSPRSRCTSCGLGLKAGSS